MKKTRRSNCQNLIKDLICSTDQPNGFCRFSLHCLYKEIKKYKESKTRQCNPLRILQHAHLFSLAALYQTCS